MLLLPALMLGSAAAAASAGFTESDVLFYGEVRQSGGGQTVLLQAGTLEVTFVNQSNAVNKVKLACELRPTGLGQTKPYSYALKVPLAYLPEAGRMDEFLSVGSTTTQFKIQEIKVNGVPATLPDGSKEFYGLNFASRSSEYQLNLLVQGSSTDSDGDGTPDWWESLYGLDPHLAETDNDLDDDGWTNLQEFQLGSDPSVSNRTPQLITSEIRVPESGEAGMYLHVLDSDTADAGITLKVAGTEVGSGFQIKVDGVPLAAGNQRQLSLAQVKAGRLSIAQTQTSMRMAAVPVWWNDGGEDAEGQVLVKSNPAGTEDGSATTLWLDGYQLPADGQSLATWSDRSGNGRHAMQPMAEYQPKVAGRAVDFEGGSSAHLFFQDAALPSGNQTVLVSYRAASSSVAAQTLLSTNRGYFHLTATAQAVSYPGAPVYQMDGLAVRGYEKSAGMTATSIFRREGTVLQNVFGHSRDGANLVANEIEPVLPTLGARRLAMPLEEGSPVDEVFHGRLNELMVFAGALPEQQLRNVSDYLESKWAGAVIWDFSTELRAHGLAAGTAGQRRIIRGGFGADQLSGGPLDDTISSGAGDDVLAGGGGADRFVFGEVDTGRDRIMDFDQTADVIDLSAMFWGMSGDARQYLTVRLDANFSTPVPTLDSVLVVTRPAGGTMEVILNNTVINSTQLIRLIVEGRIRMGGLSIPTTLQLTDNSSAVVKRESLDQSFPVIVTRSGAGVPAALDVPVGVLGDVGGDFATDGPVPAEGQRAVLRFARGETSKTLTVRPLPDLQTEGIETWQVSVLPHFRYSSGSTIMTQVVSDNPMVHVEVLEANAVAATNQPARVRIHRDGDLSLALIVDLQLAGTAMEGVHVQAVPDSISFSPGQSWMDVPVSARSSGLTAGAKVLLLRLASRDRYLLGSPYEAVLYAAISASEANNAGFDRWLLSSTNGTIKSFADLVAMAPGAVDDYLKAYAFGLASVNAAPRPSTELQIVDGRPELTTTGSFTAADLRWKVESSAELGSGGWSDASAGFAQAPHAAGLKLVGQPLLSGVQHGFYRLNLTLDPGQLAATGIAAIAGPGRSGISGDATWSSDPHTGDLVTTGGTAGETHRVITETDGPVALDFEMKITGASAGDRLSFYIDGVKKAETIGAAVRVQAQVAKAGSRLMWEFKRSTGRVVISNTEW